MAFWKKSEDPWDRKPERREAAKEETEKPLELLKGLGEELRQTFSGAEKREQLTLPPEKCPWCGQDMEQGFLNGGRGVFWCRGVPDTKTKWLGAGRGNTLRVDDEGVFYTYKTTWYCPACKKMTLDADGLRAPGEAVYDGAFDGGSPYTGAFGETPEEE